MAWVAEELFNSYTPDGTDINGGSGGSGWSGNWTESGTPSGTFVSDDAQVAEGAFSVLLAHSTGGDNSNIDRSLTTGVTAGIVYVSMRVSSTNLSSYFVLRESSANRILVRFRGATGNIEAFNNSSYQTIQAFSVDTWYRLGIEIDAANNRFRVAVDSEDVSGGTWHTVSGGSLTSIDEVRLQVDDDGNTWWDFLSPNYAESTFKPRIIMF